MWFVDIPAYRYTLPTFCLDMENFLVVNLGRIEINGESCKFDFMPAPALISPTEFNFCRRICFASLGPVHIGGGETYSVAEYVLPHRV